MKKKLLFLSTVLLANSLMSCTSKIVVNFYDDDETLLSSILINSGTTPTFDGTLPYKETNEKTYTFNGWKLDDTVYQNDELPTLYENTNFVATYLEAPRKYNITWSIDGNNIVEEYEYEETPNYKGEIKKDKDEKFTYTFKSWDKEIKPVTKDETYTAVFEKTLNEYTITFVIDGNSYTETYSYGEIPTYEEEITKEADEMYTYTFEKWDKEFSPVTKDETYTAIFSKDYRYYDITWVIGDKTEVEKYKYNEVPNFKGDTNRNPSDKYTYTFTGWDKEIIPVRSNETYIAQYDSELRSYKINFYNEDGSILLYSVDCPYDSIPEYEGTVPEKDSTEYSSFEFIGWKSNTEIYKDELPTVIGETNYYACFLEVSRKFPVVIKCIDRNGDVIKEVTVGEFAMNESYNVNAPKIDNYAPAKYKIIGEITSEENTIEITYNPLDVYDGESFSENFEGEGTQESPYLIKSGADLMLLKSNCDNSITYQDTYFKLEKSINISSVPNFRIGNSDTTTFNGYFDGNGNSIEGININSTSTRQALFYQVGKNATITNLIIEGAINGGQYAGGLAGKNLGTITNCTSYVNVTHSGGNGAGGITGGNAGTIANTTNYGDVTCLTSSNNKTGGIVGVGETGSELTACINYGNVTGYQFTAGIVAENQANAGNILDCINYGSLNVLENSKKRSDAGGIAGSIANQTLTNNKNYGTIICEGESTLYVGGIVGTYKNALIEECINYGGIENTSLYTGGIAGCAGSSSEGVISKSTNYGNITSTANGVGGILGGTVNNTCKTVIQDCSNYGTISGNDKVGGIAGTLQGESELSGTNLNEGEVIAIGENKGDLIGSLN